MIDEKTHDEQEHRDRDDECRDERRSKTPEQGEEDDDDEKGTFAQSLGNRLDR